MLFHHLNTNIFTVFDLGTLLTVRCTVNTTVHQSNKQWKRLKNVI